MLPSLLKLVYHRREDPLSIRIVYQILRSFTSAWRRSVSQRRQRDHHAESELRTLISQYLVRCPEEIAVKLWEPLAAAIESHGDEVGDFFEAIVVAADSFSASTSFWGIWDRTTKGLLAAKDRDNRLHGSHSHLARLGSALFLDNVPWKEEARDWQLLHGNERRITDYFMQIGHVPRLFGSFVLLLDGIGSRMLPDALLVVAEKLAHSDPAALLGGQNTVFCLNRILASLVYARTGELRSSPRLHEAAVGILNALVDQGSSPAYRMREYFVTPVSPTYGRPS
jgi:hypothetical protein